MSIISFESTDPKLNIYCVADVMEETYNWKMERQQRPDCLHVTLMPPHASTADQFLQDMAASVKYAMEHPELINQGSAAMFQTIKQVPDLALVDNFLNQVTCRIYKQEKQ